MFFQVQYILRDLDLPEGETLEFSEESPHRTTLVIRRPMTEENAGITRDQGKFATHPFAGFFTTEENAGVTRDQCLGILNTEELVTDKVRPKFALEDPPHPAVEEIDKRLVLRLTAFLVRAACILRWRRGLTGHPNPIAGVKRPLQWSDDGRNWQMVPGAITLHVHLGIPYKQMSDGIRSSVIELANAGEREPLGHELFQEAWKQRQELPRSSLMIGMTAAEVGFKIFVAGLIPAAEWLALHAPTPPLIQMLTDYMPSLPVKQHIQGTLPFVPKGILESLKKGVKLRNEIAHAGANVKGETLKEILLAVRDLLYLLDFYAGHAWALEVIGHEMRQAAAERNQTGRN